MVVGDVTKRYAPGVRSCLAFVLVLAACGGDDAMETTPDADGDDGATDAAPPDAADDDALDAPDDTVPVAGFGELSGMCGVLNDPELTGGSLLVRDELTFERAYVDPDDRDLLTPGGEHIAETDNAGGSSVMSEIFAYEQLARCELAPLLKTETEITYDTPGKITDLLVEIDGRKIGVSVTRAFAFPIGTPYSLSQATTLLERKLSDIQLSTENVSDADRWEKQILAYLAIDAQAADTVAEAWNNASAALKADTILLVTVTSGEDLFIYQE